ncbi:hypothetical protein ACC699_39715, partial [Rhizobium ruizarguesonis]
GNNYRARISGERSNPRRAARGNLETAMRKMRRLLDEADRLGKAVGLIFVGRVAVLAAFIGYPVRKFT